MAAPVLTQQAGRRLRGKLLELAFASPLYDAILKGPGLKGPSASLKAGAAQAWVDPWVGDAERGAALLAGRYAFAGEEIVAPEVAPFAPQGVSQAWLAELHGFAWLRDLAADGSSLAQARALALIEKWLDRHWRWQALPWRPDVTGRRVLSWLGHAGFLLPAAEGALPSRFTEGLARQTRHLARSAALAPVGSPRLTAAGGLIAGALALGFRRSVVARGLDLLGAEIAAQILSDGGHISRNPLAHAEVLRDLVQIRLILLTARHEVPEALQNAIDRMAPMLRFFRHGDGRLALFNGGREGADGMPEEILAQADAPGRPPVSARASGFERLSARRTLVLLDTGPAAEVPVSGGLAPTGLHAGLLAFELSIGRERLIVNAGAPEKSTPEWARAVRATAAHSTLTLADTNALRLDEGGRLIGPAPMVAAERSEAEGSVWIEAYHEGYRDNFGLVHRRRLYLDESGEELRGEDSLIGRPRHPLAFAIRFHVHPAVHVSLVQNGGAALLRLPSGGGFRLVVSSGSELGLEESVYLGTGALRRSEQLVIHGIAESEETIIKWFLTRVPPLPRPGGGGDRQGEL